MDAFTDEIKNERPKWADPNGDDGDGSERTTSGRLFQCPGLSGQLRVEQPRRKIMFGPREPYGDLNLCTKIFVR